MQNSNQMGNYDLFNTPFDRVKMSLNWNFLQIAILSMNDSNQSNFTDVVFGVLSDPTNVPLNPVTSSVLRSSLIELFLQDSNLTLTNSTFGQPSSFEILKFPGGITVIPEQSASIWQIPQILFNFTLNNSIDEIVVKFVELKEQLKLGLRLRPYEVLFLLILFFLHIWLSICLFFRMAREQNLGNFLKQDYQPKDTKILKSLFLFLFLFPPPFARYTSF